MTLRVAERRVLIRLGVGTGLALVVAVVLGWRAGQTPLPPLPAAAKERYSLAALKPENLEKDLAFLKFRKPWRELGQRPVANQARPGPKAPATPPWRLAGIVQRGDQSFALISTGQARTQKFEYRGVGDSLPDGSILVQITLDSAKTRSGTSPDAETHEYRLFTKKQ